MLIVTLAALAIAASEPAFFEVASIKRAEPVPVAAPGMAQRTSGPRKTEDPGRIRYADVSLRLLVAEGWQVAADQISGPAWMDGERFDVIATLPAGSRREQIPEMWRNLAESRFGVVARVEERERKTYALTVGRGALKIAPAAKGGRSALPRTPTA